MIHLPSGVTITSISPRYVHVAFDKRRRQGRRGQRRRSPAGPQHGYVVDEIKPLPATIKLRGGEAMLARVIAVRTREISLEGRTDSFVAETEVVPPDGVEVVGNPTDHPCRSASTRSS